MTRDYTRIPNIRANMAGAETRLRTAVRMAEGAGLPDTANEIRRIIKMSQIITGPGGWLDAMEAEDGTA